MANVPLQSLLEQAKRALETGAADQAIGIAHHILQYVPELIEGHRMLGEAYLNANQPQPALGAFEHVLRADPENIAAYYGLGLSHQALEQRVEAIRSFERALEIQPNLAELRTQLARLYAETPGSPSQFRLSRPGLGRLYARGQMYAQAIDEFRAVLDTQPERNDVRVALAEALWREGQEDEAADWCRECLDYQGELHKPTLILGYLQLAGGQPEGEAMWQRAARQDPHLAMAHTLFDALPPVRITEPQLPAFDLPAWTMQQDQPAHVTAPTPTTANITADDFFDNSWLGGVSTEAEQAAADPAPQPATTPMQSTTASNDDDLLASLLAIDDPPKAADSEGGVAQAPPPGVYDTPVQSGHTEAADEHTTIKPFSFDDLNFDERTNQAHDPFHFQETSTANLTSFGRDDAPSTKRSSPGADEQTPAISASIDNGALQPWSFNDFDGNVKPFSLDEPGGVHPFSWNDFNFGDTAAGSSDTLMKTVSPEAAATAAAPEEDEAADSEFFSLDGADAPATGVPPAAPPLASSATTGQPAARSSSALDTTAEPEVVPFSLADLGLTEEEIASFTKTHETDRPASALLPSVVSDESDLAPFSLADLGLTEDEIAEFTQSGASRPASSTPPAPTPSPASTSSFSLSELGLTEEEISNFDLGESPLPSATQITQAEASSAEAPAPIVGSPAAPQPAPPTADEAKTRPDPQPAAPHQPALPPVAQMTQSASIPAQLSQAPVTRPSSTATQPAAPASMPGMTDLQSYRTQLAAEPNNDTLRLAIARMSEQTGDLEQALGHYKQLLRRGVLVNSVVDDLQELIATQSEPVMLRRLHRLLGDAYTKQDRFREAVEEYSWTQSRGS